MKSNEGIIYERFGVSERAEAVFWHNSDYDDDIHDGIYEFCFYHGLYHHYDRGSDVEYH